MRFMTIAAALLACMLCIEVALFVAGLFGEFVLWLHAHGAGRWFLPLSNLLTVAFLVIAGFQRKKAVVEHDRMTPLVRRDPKTGLRLL